MIKNSGILFIILGILLIGSALSLHLYNRQEDLQAALAAADLMEKLQTMPTAEETVPMETRPTEMATVAIDGYDYIGYLSIPTLELELPVMAQWDYARLKIAPCRESGATTTDDLVIAAHNYTSNFGRLNQLQGGDSMTFTEMDGYSNAYCVEKVMTLEPDQVDAVLLSGYDLVLYTCTKGGATRVVVYCNRTPQASA